VQVLRQSSVTKGKYHKNDSVRPQFRSPHPLSICMGHSAVQSEQCCLTAPHYGTNNIHTFKSQDPESLNSYKDALQRSVTEIR
jgi:hypothetical protein